MQSIFGKDGLLNRALSDYEYRPMQEAMATEVEAALAEGRPSIIEAGTGTGKTLAYLIPAILNGRKTIISTGTKTLQDQILEHDIPFLKRHLPGDFRVVCMKGRANYLCLYRFHRFFQQPELFEDAGEISTRKLLNWSQQTASGDRAEIDWLPDDFGGWERMSARGDQCLGQKCSRFEECFLTRLRQEAATAEVIVINHHLFFADLAVRSGGYGQVIPPYEVAIFDEAHLLEETATSYFSIQVSSYRLFELFRDIAWELAAVQRLESSFERRVESTARLSTQFFDCIPASDRRHRFHLNTFTEEFYQRWFELVQGLEQLSVELFRMEDLSEGVSACHRRTQEITQDLRVMVEQDNQNYVYWYESRGKGRFLWGSPVRVAPILHELLFQRPKPHIFTSATLAVGKKLEFFRTRLGLPPETAGMILAAPFFYKEQAVIYLPTHLTLPNSPNFIQEISREMEAILEETEGRAFILFTSYRNLNGVHARLAKLGKYTLLVQGEQPKATLLQRFREDTTSVLLGTTSFWQGVDMPGETLSCVIIDKLPFAAPNDPLVGARLDMIAAEGGNPFWEYQVPGAILALRQGLGRLIRRSTDCGVLAILDGRLYKRSYGKLFLESLPDSSITNQREDIGRFLDSTIASQC